MSDDCKSAGILPGTSCFSSTGLLPGTSSEVSSSGILPGTSCFSSTGLLPGTSCPSSRVLMLCGNKTNDHATHSQVLMLYGNEASVHENIGLASIHENIGQAVYDDNPRYQASCEDQSQATYKHDIPREVSDVQYCPKRSIFVLSLVLLNPVPMQTHAFLSCVAKIEVKQHPMERITKNMSKTIRDIRDPIRAFLCCMVKIPQITSVQYRHVKMLSSVRYRHVRMLLSVQYRMIHMTYPMRDQHCWVVLWSPQ